MYQRRYFLVTMVLAMLVLGLLWGCADNSDDNDPNAPPDGPCSLSVTDPLGGETFFSGTAEYILWDQENAGDLVKIELFKFHDIQYDTTFRDTVIDDVPTMVVDYIDTTRADTTLVVLDEATQNDGSTAWTVTTGPALTDVNYSIKVSSLDDSQCASRTDWFTIIKTENCEIYVLVPQDTVWTVGDNELIQWESEETGGTVDIYLYKLIEGESRPWYAIAIAAPDTGGYPWKVFSCHDGAGNTKQYQIRVSDSANSNCADFSEFFGILDETPCNIDVTAPAFGDAWEYDEEYQIVWHANDPNVTVDIYVNPPGLSPILIASGVPSSDSSYYWTVDPTVVNAGDGFSITVIVDDDECCLGTSAPFSIVEG